MCGRFFRRQPRDELAAAFRAAPFGELRAPSYNIAPSQPVYAVRFNSKTGQRTLEPLLWGLIPHFATDRKIAFKCINARAETVDTLRSFRSAFAKRRCLVLANGFFEWQARGKAKLPFAFTRADEQAFGLAGLWEVGDPTTGEWVRSCSLITTTANELVRKVHDRMPVILEPQNHALWLGEEPSDIPHLKQLLRPLRADSMVSWPVSPRMNKPSIDDVSVLDPIDDSSDGPLLA